MHIFFKLNTAEMKKNILQEIIHYKLYIILSLLFCLPLRYSVSFVCITILFLQFEDTKGIIRNVNQAYLMTLSAMQNFMSVIRNLSMNTNSSDSNDCRSISQQEHHD